MRKALGAGMLSPGFSRTSSPDVSYSGYIIEDGDGNEIDSCWGLYGSDYAETEAFAAVPDNPPEVPYSEDEDEI